MTVGGTLLCESKISATSCYEQLIGIMLTNEHGECIFSEAVKLWWLTEMCRLAVFQSSHPQVCHHQPPATAVNCILCQIVVAAIYYFFTVVYSGYSLFSSCHYQVGQYSAQPLNMTFLLLAANANSRRSTPQHSIPRIYTQMDIA